MRENEALSSTLEEMRLSYSELSEEKDVRINDFQQIQAINEELMDENERFKQMLDESSHEFLDSSLMDKLTLVPALPAKSIRKSSVSSGSGTMINLFSKPENVKIDMSEELDESRMRNQMLQTQIASLQLYIEKILGRIAKKRLEETVFSDLE
jgi:FtsZ-binding cell division protein ZapB